MIAVKHIKSVDGFTGCYRGLVPKLCGNLVSAVASQKILDSLDLDIECNTYVAEGLEENK